MRVLLAVGVLVAATSGCSQMDRMTRPRDASYAYTDTADKAHYTEQIDADLSLEVRCIRHDSTQSKSGVNKQDTCAYKSVNEAFRAGETGPSALSAYFHKCGTGRPDAQCVDARNRVVDLLLKVSDDNCSTFLQRTFLAKSTSDSAYGFGRDMLTGGTAAVASASPPSAVGLSLANLMLGSYESVNSTFFLNAAYQSLETAINMEREARLTALRNQCTRPTNQASAGYNGCTMHEALRLVKSYGDACSLRTGVNKLQSLVHLQQNSAEVVKVRGDLEGYKVQLAASEQQIKRQNEQMAVMQDAIARSVLDQLSPELKALHAEIKAIPTQEEQAASPSDQDTTPR